MSWLDHVDSDEFRDLIALFGSMRRAALEAMQSEYKDEFKRIGARIEVAPDGEEYEVVPYREIEGTFARLVIAAHRDKVAPTKAVATKRSRDDGGPARIPEAIVELALQLHEREGYGRRKLDQEIPGLTDYQAGQVLGWYRIGKPAGLWLEDGRLKLGRAISTTPDGVRLPRL